MAEKKKFIRTIDCEPTWESLLSELLRKATDPMWPVEREVARRELHKMARAADAYRALQKAGKVP